MRYHLMSINQQAVVVGDGLDALLTARILVDHFQHVAVVMSGTWSAAPDLPQNIWQALPVHLLAVQGQRNLERLFPGLTAELLAARAPTIEWTADAAALLPGGWSPRFHSDLVSRPVTPNLLLHVIRHRLLDYAGDRVTFLEGREVAGLRQRTAQQIVLRSLPQDTLATLPADVIVNATEQPAHMADWLRTGGYAAPPKTMIQTETGLVARLYRQPAGFQAGWQALLALPTKHHPGGVLVPTEHGQWLVLLAAPTRMLHEDEAEFLNLAARLRTPALYESLRGAAPLTPVFRLDRVEMVRWHYEQADDWPDHVLVTGRAMTAFHPAYGFDVTASTIAALALREALDEQRKRYPDGDLKGLSSRFYHRLARQYALPWLLLNPLAAAQKRRTVRRYFDRLLATAHADAQVFHDLVAVAGAVASSRVLLRPALLRRMIRRRPVPEQPAAEPPEFEPARYHKTFTQEVAATVATKEQQ